jgi:tetratricopeptide (TPR) repeat protein
MIFYSEKNQLHLLDTFNHIQFYKKMKTLTIFLSMLMPIIALGQSSRLNYADKQYEQLAYYYAIEAYLDVLERGTDSSEISSKIADCYFQLNEVQNAVTWYDYINRKQTLNKEQHIRLAMLKRQLADYDGSLDTEKMTLQKQ